MPKLAELKSQTSIKDTDRQEWALLSALATHDDDQLMKVLGFDKARILSEVEKYTGKKQVHKGSESSQALHRNTQ